MRQQKDGKSNISAAAFWRFSLALYSRPGVAEALLALQDRAGLDINLILFALWRGLVHGHPLEKDELKAAETAAAPLRRAVVLPLRELRRRLKGDRDPDMQALRRQITVLELAAERRAQSRLAAATGAFESKDDRRAAAERNLALCLGAEAQSAEAAILRRTIVEFTRRD